MRRSRRGSALSMAMAFFVVITISGTALLSVSLMHRTDLVRRGLATRLLIAAEAGVETLRGRFAIVSGVQDNWNELLPDAGWNNVGSLVINGYNVQVQAMPQGPAPYLNARLRGIASSGTATQVVEVGLEARSSFPQYAMFSDDDIHVSGSQRELQGAIHTNANTEFSGQHWDVNGEISAGGSVTVHPDTQTEGITQGAPTVTVPSMASAVPATSAATVVLNGDRNISSFVGNAPDASGWTIVWIRNGKLNIWGPVTGKVWFIVDNGVIVVNNLTAATEHCEIRIHSKADIEVPNYATVVTATLIADQKVKLAGGHLVVTGLVWGKVLVEISGSDVHLTGAVLSNGEIRVSGSDSTIIYKAGFTDFIPGYDWIYGKVPASWRNYEL